MKTTKRMNIPVCMRAYDHDVNELCLMADNEYPAYAHLEYDWYNLYGKKIANGTFTKQRAIDGLVNIFVPRLAKYVRKTYGRDAISPRLTLAQKTEVAEHLLSNLKESFEYNGVKKGVKFVPKEGSAHDRKEISRFW